MEFQHMLLVDHFLLALALNIDCAILVFALTIVLERFSIRKTIKWGLWFGIFQGLLLWLGWWLVFQADFIRPWAAIVTGVVFIGLGLKIIIGVLQKRSTRPEISQTFLKMVLLSLGVSADALVAGFGLPYMSSEAIAHLSVLVGAIGFAMSLTSGLLAHRVKVFPERIMLFAGALILIFLGLKSFV
jgi:putative Mn2+ efflux pump MntP